LALAVALGCLACSSKQRISYLDALPSSFVGTPTGLTLVDGVFRRGTQADGFDLDGFVVTAGSDVSYSGIALGWLMTRGSMFLMVFGS